MSGLSFGSACGRAVVPKTGDWYMDQKININDLITQVLPVEQINDVFNLMNKGELIRAIITF